MQNSTRIVIALIAVAIVGGAVWYMTLFNHAEVIESETKNPETSLEEVSTTGMSRPAHPVFNTDERCTWVWNEVADVGIWGEECTFGTDVWKHVRGQFEGFNLTLNGAVFSREMEVFEKGADETMESMLERLQVLGVPADGCEMQQNLGQSADAYAVYEIVPTGKRLARVESLIASGEIPADECGLYGMSASSQRFFQVFTHNPTKVVFLNFSEEGTLLDVQSLTVKKL